MKCFKTCIIIYGFIINTITDYINEYVNLPIILIEPRKKQLDEINILKNDKDLYKNIIVISKLLHNDNKMSEITLYKTQDHAYSVQSHESNCFISKEKVFTTSLYNIVTEYKIQNIERLVFNINVDNIPSCLDNGYCFSHIISYINVNKTFYNDIDIKNILKSNTISEFFTKSDTNIIDNNYLLEHKNLHIPLPKISMYVIDDVPNEIKDKFELLVAQYNINVCFSKPYLKKKAFNKHYIPIYDHTVSCLDNIFNNKDIEKNIIIQFNPKYLLNNDFFQIRYPLKDNALYINRDYDIIYGTKNCIHMLYQIIKSSYFTEHMNNLKISKKIMFNLFCKQYFYDYIGKIFETKETNKINHLA
jgi:hypothetical protein